VALLQVCGPGFYKLWETRIFGFYSFVLRFDNPLEISDEPGEEIVWAYTKKGTLGLTVTVFLLVTSIVIDRLGRRLLLLIGLGFMSFVMIFSYLFLLFYDQSGNHVSFYVCYLFITFLCPVSKNTNI